MKKLTSLIPPKVRRQISQTRRIESVISAVLPSHMAEGLHLGTIENDCCHLTTNNPGFAENLRFYERDICTVIAREMGRPITRVKLSIRRNTGEAKVKASPVAEKATDNKPINAARLRLREVVKKL